MEIGDKLAIKSVKKVEPKKGDSFYLLTLIENVYNKSKPYKNKKEAVFYEAYVFDTDVEFEEADFSLGKSKDKYNFRNIANKEKSVIRVLDFSFEYRTIWVNGKQQYDYGKPKYKALIYVKKFAFLKEKYVTDEKKIEKLEDKISKLEEKVAYYKAKFRSRGHDYIKLKKQFRLRGITLRGAQKELQNIKEPKIKKQKHYKELEDIRFDDM